MSTKEEKEVSYRQEFLVALIYSVLLVAVTIILQNAARNWLKQFDDIFGGFILSIATFVFALILTSIGKAVIKFFMGDHFLLKSFIAFSCILLCVVCLLASPWLIVWWLTAFFSIVGTVLSFFKKLFVRKTTEKVKEVRDLERDLRHQSIHDAKALGKKSIHEAREMRDRLRGKR